MQAETLVRDYLNRLESAAALLPVDRRDELVDDVRGHIDLALAEVGGTDEAAVRNVLERLGTPAEIVAADIEPDGPLGRVGLEAEPEVRSQLLASAATSPVARRPWGTGEAKALLLLTAGAVLLPIVGQLLALGFVWSSARWTGVQKRTATFAIVSVLTISAIVLIPLLMQGEITAIFSAFGEVVVLVPLAGLLTAAYLFGVLYLEVSFVTNGSEAREVHG